MIRCKVYDDWPSHGRYVRTLEAGTLIGPVTDFWHGPTFSTIETSEGYINVWRRSGLHGGVNFASACGMCIGEAHSEWAAQPEPEPEW